MYGRAMLLAATTLLQWASGEAQLPCTAGTYIPHPTDCSSYFFCDSQSIQQNLSCTPGYSFNPVTTICERGLTCPVPTLTSKEVDATAAEVQKEGWTRIGGPGIQADNNKEIEIIPSLSSEGVPEEEVKKYVDQTTAVESEAGESASNIFDGPFLTALENFTKALEIGGESKEDVESKKEGRELLLSHVEEVEANVTTSGGLSNPTEVAADFETTSTVASESTSDSSSEKKAEGRCGADSVVVGYPTVAPLEGRKAEEDSEEGTEDVSKTDSKEIQEGKLDIENQNITDSYTLATLWPLFSLNGSFKNDQVGKDLLELSPVLVDKGTQTEPQNVTSEDITDTKIPDYSFTDVKQFSPSNTKDGPLDNASTEKEDTEKLNAGDENPTEKVEEIEEAKSTLIFESHTTIKPTDSVGYFPEGQSKVIIGNPIF